MGPPSGTLDDPRLLLVGGLRVARWVTRFLVRCVREGPSLGRTVCVCVCVCVCVYGRTYAFTISIACSN